METADQRADAHVQVVNEILTKANAVDVLDSDIAAGAEDALVDLRRHAAQLIAQGLDPEQTLRQMVSIKGLLGIIRWRKEEAEKKAEAAARAANQMTPEQFLLRRPPDAGG